MGKPRLLWVGDAVAHTGFARVTHNVCGALVDRWDINVVGVNYFGDPHSYPYPIWPAANDGRHDAVGIARLGDVAQRCQPDLICILNDPWIIADGFLAHHAQQPVPIVAYMPVDARNISSAARLNTLATAIFYTEFGLQEARAGGFTGRAAIIPHGVDMACYEPIDRAAARHTLGLDRKLPPNAFIVGNVNRNQPRKRLDLTIAWFAKWWAAAGCPPEAYLYLHCSPKDIGWNLKDLAKYFGIEQRVIFTSNDITAARGIPESMLRVVYGALDVLVSTTLGEGWGLTTHEAMACGIPAILPDSAAYSEWCLDAAALVHCDGIAATADQVNTIGQVASREAWISALEYFYRDPDARLQLGARAFLRARETRFQWPLIADQFHAVFAATLEAHAAKSSEQADPNGRPAAADAPAGQHRQQVADDRREARA